MTSQKTKRKDPSYDLDNVINRAIKVTKPSKVELTKLMKIEENIRKEIDGNRLPGIVDIQTYGAFAKETGVKKDTDIDIFILIDKNIDEVNFEKIALDVGYKSLKKFKPSTRYAEHPYVEGFVKLSGKDNDEVKINIVPCYDVEKGHWKSSADRSRYHTKYMTEMLSENQKDQVRILKAFLKSAGIYGAELSKSGFSGYVTEVLILKFGDFKKVIQNIADLKNVGEIIAIDDYDNKKYNKFSSPIIIVDPIDPNRNLGAAISLESLSIFIMTARSFLRNPSINFFNLDTTYIPKNFTNKFVKLKDLLSKLVILEISYSKRSPDIIWGQIKKLAKSISKQLAKEGFRVIRSDCYIEEKNIAKIVLLLDLKQISEYVENIGPNIFMESEVSNFIDRNKNKSDTMWINEDMRIACLNKRNNIDCLEFLRKSLTDNKNVIAIPSGLLDDINKGFKIYTGNRMKLTAGDNKKIVYNFLLKNKNVFEN